MCFNIGTTMIINIICGMLVCMKDIGAHEINTEPFLYVRREAMKKEHGDNAPHSAVVYYQDLFPSIGS